MTDQLPADQPIDEHGSALTRIMESALRERGLHPDQRPVVQDKPSESADEPQTPASDPISEIGYKTAAVMEEAMQPLAADEFKIGQLSDFGKALPPYDEWDGETETDARSWMAAAQFNEGQARSVQHAFMEAAQHDFSPEFAERNEQASHSYLLHQYGDQKDEAIAACKRVIDEIGGQKLRDWLNDTGVGNSPAVVFECCRLAERKSYLTRKAAQS